MEIGQICVITNILILFYQVPVYRLNQWAEWISGEECKVYVEDHFFDSMSYDSRRYRYSVYNDDAFQELENRITEDEDSFYFLNFSTTIQTLYYPYNPMKNAPFEEIENCTYLSGVLVEFPDMKKRLEAQGVANPIKSLLDEKVYLVDNYYQENILEYLKEHYGEHIRMELKDTVDGFQIWKYYKE